jgi:uncharacterized membrane protein
MLKYLAIGMFSTSLLVQTGGQAPKPSAADEKEFKTKVAPIIKKYCIKCHGIKNSQDNINYETAKTMADVLKNTRHWKKGGREVSEGKMPPENEQKPSAKEKALLVKWADKLPRAQRPPSGPGGK